MSKIGLKWQHNKFSTCIFLRLFSAGGFIGKEDPLANRLVRAFLGGARLRLMKGRAIFRMAEGHNCQ